jgi:hypothetical protein
MGSSNMSKSWWCRHLYGSVPAATPEDPHAEWVAILTRWLLGGCVTVIILVAFLKLT